MAQMTEHPLAWRLWQRTMSIKHTEKRNLLTRNNQLMRHLQRKQSSESIPEKMIRSVRLKSANLLYVTRSHVLNASEWILFVIKTGRLQTINRLMRTEMTNQRSVDKDMRAACVHTMERWSRTFRLNCYE